jgi:hypothetical protein
MRYIIHVYTAVLAEYASTALLRLHALLAAHVGFQRTFTIVYWLVHTVYWLTVHTVYGVYVQNFVNATVNLAYDMARHPSMITAECSSSIESSLDLAELDNYTQ